MAASAAAAGTRTRSSSETQGRDWRIPPGDEGYPRPENLTGLRCPFGIDPSPTPRVPLEYIRNVIHLETGTNDAPWTGYYTVFAGFKHAVENAYGVWFEIRKRNAGWEAF